MSGVSLRLDLFTSPVSPYGAAGDAACRTRHRFPGLEPVAPLHADPVARALGPGANRNRPRWVQLGWPQILRLLTTTPLPTPHPKVTCHPPPEGDRSPGARRPRACPVVSPHRSPAAGCPVPSERSSRPPFPTSPEGGRRPGLTRRPPRSPATFADSSLPPSSRRSPAARSEVAVNTVRAPTPLSLREAVWAGPKPPPHRSVGVRSPERASVNTAHNPRSRGIFEFTGLSPELSRYPQDSFRRPPVAHRSCTTMCTVRRHCGAVDCIRWPKRVQWGPMTNTPVAAIIIISVEHVAPPRVRRAALRAALSVLGSTSCDTSKSSTPHCETACRSRASRRPSTTSSASRNSSTSSGSSSSRVGGRVPTRRTSSSSLALNTS